jgi:hypothetical protein
VKSMYRDSASCFHVVRVATARLNALGCESVSHITWIARIA